MVILEDNILISPNADRFSLVKTYLKHPAKTPATNNPDKP